MRKITMFLVSVCALVFFSTALSATTCDAKFMKDPCSLEGYSIVNTEKFVRGRHNWMHDIHHFGEKKRVQKIRKKRVHKARNTKRRYKYVKRCRLIKIRR